jgi:hypothetical protein
MENGKLPLLNQNDLKVYDFSYTNMNNELREVTLEV